MWGISVRFVLAVVSVACALSLSAQSSLSGDDLLQRGREHFRAGRYAEAAGDLSSAAQAYLASEALQEYVKSGRFEKLPQLETALIYLALAHDRLGNEAEARDAVLRLATAERVAPVFATLTLQEDAAGFEALASRLVPNIEIGSTVHLAGGAAPPAPGPPAPAPPTSTPSQRVAVSEQMVAQDCARIEREAEERIAAAQRAADERVAAAQRAADERVAAAERAAAERIAGIERDAAARIAAAETSARATIAEQRPPARPLPPPAPQPVPAPVPEQRAETLGRDDWQTLLRRADEFAEAGRVAEAVEIYARVAAAAVPREALARAATGLYRTRAYQPAVGAFARLAPFGRGEEDLRYYYAVSLFESGRYAQAQHELACALPFLQLTDDVIRYRMRIEQMVAWQQALPAVAERGEE
jgi:tetratricopeptide (TPR) repeat protein